jgi:putative hydrolase of the HAD superfamily
VPAHGAGRAVTNATSRLDLDLERLGLAGEFDGVVNSSAVGWIKPQREIFGIALSVAGVPAAHALFVDDSTENVTAAARLGMTAHLYRGIERLKHELARHKLLS